MNIKNTKILKTKKTLWKKIRSIGLLPLGIFLVIISLIIILFLNKNKKIEIVLHDDNTTIENIIYCEDQINKESKADEKLLGVEHDVGLTFIKTNKQELSISDILNKCTKITIDGKQFDNILSLTEKQITESNKIESLYSELQNNKEVLLKQYNKNKKYLSLIENEE